jgi:hypothetical protein
MNLRWFKHVEVPAPFGSSIQIAKNHCMPSRLREFMSAEYSEGVSEWQLEHLI